MQGVSQFQSFRPAASNVRREAQPRKGRYGKGEPETGLKAAGLPTSLTLLAMSLGYGVVQLDVTIVNTALGSIGTSLGGGVSELQWIVSAYTIAFAAFILTAGALGDRIGAKRVFMAGRHLHRRLDCVRAGDQCRRADCGKRRSGTWRGNSGSQFARLAQSRLSRPEAA